MYELFLANIELKSVWVIFCQWNVNIICTSINLICLLLSYNACCNIRLHYHQSGIKLCDNEWSCRTIILCDYITLGYFDHIVWLNCDDPEPSYCKYDIVSLITMADKWS